ncbi:unnamed protein product [Brassica rapa]|uniref:Uncharacterized protein n=1 Tax=Brassica campestris TaxID=3711 RepID=A0A8D9D7M4_BRACM|nr:unnamed protein product [Brassica rapa]
MVLDYTVKRISSAGITSKILPPTISLNFFLLVLGKNEHEDGFYNDLMVKQDNVFREFAMHQCEKESILQRKRLNMDIQENKFPNWFLNLKQPIVLNASLLSISTDDSFTSYWVETHCTNVEVLVLNLYSSNYGINTKLHCYNEETESCDDHESWS